MFGYVHPVHENELMALVAACYHQTEKDIQTKTVAKTLMKQEWFGSLFAKKFKEVYNREPTAKETRLAALEAIRLAGLDSPRTGTQRLRREPPVREGGTYYGPSVPAARIA